MNYSSLRLQNAVSGIFYSETKVRKRVEFMKIRISDRTLCREENAFSFKEKLEIARQLQKLNADCIELPAIDNVKTDTLLIKTMSSFVKDSVISVAVGMNKDGVENASAALINTAKPRLRIELPVSTVGMEYTCHKKADKMTALIGSLVAEAKGKFDDVEFCAVDATRADKEELKAMITTAIESGATSVSVCDSAAEMMPEAFGKFISEIKGYIGDVSLGVICSNKNGLAAANAVIAASKGADTVKTDVCGDTVSLETMAGIIKNCGISCGFTSDIKYTELNRIVNQIGWIIGNSKNEKNNVTVSVSDDNSIILDSKDSIETVTASVLKLGYDLSDEDSAKVYDEFLKVASNKNVGAKELDAIVASVALQVPPTYKLVSYVINNGNIISSSAQITLLKDGKEIQGVCIGNGPVAAAFLAIEQIIGCHYELDDFQIQSVTEGKQALGSAIVKLRSGGKLYSGNGISTDIIGAAIKAYIGAVNKIVYEEA